MGGLKKGLTSTQKRRQLDTGLLISAIAETDELQDKKYLAGHPKLFAIPSVQSLINWSASEL